MRKAIGLVVLLGACVPMSTYSPGTSPSLKQTVEDGRMYWRVGERRVAPGLTFAELPDLVAAVDSARIRAEDAHNGMLSSWKWLGATLGLLGGSVGLFLYDARDGRDLDVSRPVTVTALAMFVGGIATEFIAINESTKAHVAYLDAVNIYNDAMWNRYAQANVSDEVVTNVSSEADASKLVPESGPSHVGQ